jgi:hypothetical protein
LNIWTILEIPHGSDRDAIRRAYAKKLRVTHPEDDPEGFKQLRAAYEAALRHLEYQSWHDIEDDEDGEDQGDDVIAAAEPLSWNRPQAETQHAPGEPVLEPELDSMLAAREAELEALRTAMAELEKGLRGPWRPDDSALGMRLEAILRSPALAEIRIRTDVEPWLADLLAATIPHSDAVLLQSIQAFGWLDGDRKRGFNPAIAAVLDRLDEWRLIESLNHPSHVHHAAWRSLTRPPGAWWRWRIAAFKPGMIAGIEIFLGIRGQVARGLHYSYRKESVERWQRFLAKPRLTFGILALMPLTLLGLFGFGTVVAGTDTASSAIVIGGMSAIAFATPFAALFLLARWQQRWRERPDHARWLSDGWLAGYIALPFVAMAVPPPLLVLVALPAIGIAVWAYIVAPPAEPGSLRPGGGVALSVCAACLIFATLPKLDAGEIFALGVFAALLAYLRLSLWSATRALLGRVLWRHREWMILGVTAVGLAAALGALLLRASWYPVAPIYPFALATAALLPIVGAPQAGAQGRSRGIPRIALLFVFLWAFGASVPPSERVNPSPAVQLNAPGTDDAESRADAAMTVLEHNQPGFAQIREGNPALYAEISAVMQHVAAGEIKRDQAGRQIDALVNSAYFRMLPDAGNGLLVQSLRLRLDRLQALRKTAPALCVDDSTAVLPKGLRDLQNQQAFDVVSSPPTEAAPGRIIGGDVLLAQAAAAQQVDQAIFLERVKGRKGADAACAARIAITQALLYSDSVEDIAATLRDQYRRARRTSAPAATDQKS